MPSGEDVERGYNNAATRFFRDWLLSMYSTLALRYCTYVRVHMHGIG